MVDGLGICKNGSGRGLLLSNLLRPPTILLVQNCQNLVVQATQLHLPRFA